MIKAITFDLDGVYFVNGKTNFIRALVNLGVPEEKTKLVFLQSDQMNKFYKTGKMSDKGYWSWAIKEWGLNMTVEAIIRLLINGYEINPQVVRTVKQLRKNGYKTLICSNNFPARVNGLQHMFSLMKLAPRSLQKRYLKN